jgi:hypothetical protein
MAEAKQHYHEHKTYAMARFLANKEVIEAIRRKEDKVAHYSAKELIDRADAYIKEHHAAIMREVAMRK